VKDFWDAFNSSTLIQGVLACSLTGGVVYLSVTHQQIPDVLGTGFSMMLGYFFAAKGILTGRDLAIKAMGR
jgi:hypothetical protein